MALSEDIDHWCNKMDEDGYDLIQIMGVEGGRYDWKCKTTGNSGFGYGYGFSVTDGVVLLFKLKP